MAYILYKHNCVLYDIKPVDQFKFRLEITRSLLRKGKWARTRTKAGVEGTVDTEERCCLVQVSAIGLKRGRCFHCTQVKRPKIGSTSFGCSKCRWRCGPRGRAEDRGGDGVKCPYLHGLRRTRTPRG